MNDARTDEITDKTPGIAKTCGCCGKKLTPKNLAIDKINWDLCRKCEDWEDR